MSKNAVITVDAAKAAGVAVKAVASNLKSLADREAVEGALAISFERIALTSQMRQILDRPEVEAMILHAGRDLHTYEIAEMRDRSMPDQVVIGAAKQALLSGYLLADAAGPHFTIIAGKGAQATAMIKEAGHRYKLAQAGCTDIRVVSCSLGMRQRPNAAGKFDMLVAGTASCVHNGKPVQIERPRDMPYTLPCYESDGPDGHEAKARRRLLRDLWCAVSGEFALNSEDEIEQPAVQVVDTTPPRIAEQQIRPQALYDGTRADLVAYCTNIKAPDQRLAFQSILDVIDTATDPEELQARKEPEIRPALQQLGVKRSVGEMVFRLVDQRCSVLEAGT